MTYCVGLQIDRGIVLMSDTRTNSGVDYISSFRKLHHWTVPGNRTIALLSSGNLATTQAVVSKLEERSKAPDDRHNSLMDAPTMFQVATMVGEILRETFRESTPSDAPEAADTFTASFIHRTSVSPHYLPIPVAGIAHGRSPWFDPATTFPALSCR